MGIKRHIPNVITSMSLLCGILGVIFTLEGKIAPAFPLMLAAAGCDFCDGLVARLLKAQSGMGRELDSLADLVSFGVLPALMLYKMMGYALLPRLLCLLPVLLALASAWRLAKFNTDERQHDGFLGLPTPASAMICGSLAYYTAVKPISWIGLACGTVWFIPVLTLLLCILLLCEIPMFSMKLGRGNGAGYNTKIKRTAFVTIVAILIIMVVVLGENWSLVILTAFPAYVLMNLIFALSPSTR